MSSPDCVPDFPDTLRQFLQKPRTMRAIARKMQWHPSNTRARLHLLTVYGFVVKYTAKDLRESSKWKIAEGIQ